jgi:hypothetical protein
MSLSVKEYPTIGTDNIFCNWNKAWLDKSRRVEDFVREIAVGGEDDESANDRLVDTRYSIAAMYTCGRLIYSLVCHWPIAFCIPQNLDIVLE